MWFKLRSISGETIDGGEFSQQGYAVVWAIRRRLALGEDALVLVHEETGNNWKIDATIRTNLSADDA